MTETEDELREKVARLQDKVTDLEVEVEWMKRQLDNIRQDCYIPAFTN